MTALWGLIWRMKSQTESYASYQKQKAETVIFGPFFQLLFALLSWLALPACLIPFSFGDEPVSNCLMSSQGTWAQIPPCFQSDRSVKGTDRTYKVTYITNYALCLLAEGSVNHASCPALCPPTTSAVNHNVTETDYLAALYFQFSYWREMELQNTVTFNDTFINHRRRQIYLQCVNMLHKFQK